jgi:hypothetical protein
MDRRTFHSINELSTHLEKRRREYKIKKAWMNTFRFNLYMVSIMFFFGVTTLGMSRIFSQDKIASEFFQSYSKAAFNSSIFFGGTSGVIGTIMLSNEILVKDIDYVDEEM